MSKLVTSDNLKAYHGELAEHLQLLERDKTYSVGDTVKYDGLTLKCTIAGNTDVNKVDYSSIDVGDTIVDGTVTFTVIDPNSMWYEEDKFYMIDDIVVYNDKFYKCITAHTATATFDTTKWSEISAGGGGSSGGGISVWQANTAYNVDDIVIDSNLIWKCIVSHTSTATFDESKWVCISGGEISNGMEIVPLWEGSFSFSNSTQGATPTSSTPMINLSDSVQNYEYLYVTLSTSDNNFSTNLIEVDNYVSKSFRLYIVANTSYYISSVVKFTDSTHMYIDWVEVVGYISSNCRITSVQGIRKAKPIVSSGMKYETLWEGEAGSLSGSGSTTISLSDNVNKYQKLGLSLSSHSGGGDYRTYYVEVNVTDYLDFITNGSSGDRLSYGWWGNADYYFEIKNDSTSTQLSVVYRDNIITKVVGISEGVVIPTGVQAARVTLFEGSIGNSSGSSIISVALSDNYNNYDVLGFYSTVYYRSDSIKYIYREVQSSHITDMISSGNSSYEVAMNWGWSTSDDYVSINKDSIANNLSIYVNKTIVTKIIGIKYIQPDSYSTQEKLIGTWIDGKPLYQKTIQITIPNIEDSDNIVNTFDINYNIVDMIFIVKNLNNGNIYTSNYYASQFDYITVWIEDNYIYVRQRNFSNSTSYITIKYTKN